MTEMPEENGEAVADDELKAWVKKTMDAAVDELMRRGVVDSVVVEARPAWTLPFSLLIGQVREQGAAEAFDWFICGDSPVTVAKHTVAASPREAARHFALQWQLEAARQGADGEALSQRAGALYELVEEDSLWIA